MSGKCIVCGLVSDNDSDIHSLGDKMVVSYGYNSDFDTDTYAFADPKEYRWEHGRRYIVYLDEAGVKERYSGGGDGVCNGCTRSLVREGHLRYLNHADYDFWPGAEAPCDLCGEILSCGSGQTSRSLLTDSLGTNHLCGVVREDKGIVKLVHFIHHVDEYTPETLYWASGFTRKIRKHSDGKVLPKLLTEDMLVCRCCATSLVNDGLLVSSEYIDKNFPTRELDPDVLTKNLHWLLELPTYAQPSHLDDEIVRTRETIQILHQRRKFLDEVRLHVKVIDSSQDDLSAAKEL